MIHYAIDHVVERLNAYIAVRTGNADQVVQGNLLDQTGTEAEDVKEKVVLCLVNVEEDSIFRANESYIPSAAGTLQRIKPEARLNLYVLFVANHSNYTESLKSLSYVIGYFQNESAYDYASIPEMEGDGKLVLSLHSLSFEQINHVWGAMGAKYRPSVMYQMRIVVVRDTQVASEALPVTEIRLTT